MSAIPQRLLPLEKLPEGLDAGIHRAQSWVRRRPGQARRLRQQAVRCSQRCDGMSDLEPRTLERLLLEAQEHARRDPLELKGKLIEAFAALGQVAKRQLGLQPYPVQFMGALALHQGWAAEMATGEGKTLTVAMAAVVLAWSGRPCHVVTANDYLAERDAQTMRRLFEACGLQVESVHDRIPPDARAARYAADVVYVTPKELLADYLRDQIAASTGANPQWQAFQRWVGARRDTTDTGCVLVRGLHSAIVDEADSVLIDEAVTPLILSAQRPSRGLSEAVVIMARLAASLVDDADYRVVARTRLVELKDGAVVALDRIALDLPAVWRPAPRREELLRQALQVRHFFRAGHEYLIDDGKVVLLDELTGRMAIGRTLTAGMHQAVEAREGVEITDPNESLTQMSSQAFFRGFSRLSGTSGTLSEAASELWQVYRLAVMRIPTHRPRQTVMRPAQLIRTQDEKWQRIASEVAALHSQGRAVLVGVRSVESSTYLADLLRDKGLIVRVLNAVRHAEEAQIIARAGEPGCITIATNMAGRGTDIALASPLVSSGGLHVIIAEVNDSARIDRQLAGRCGRQGDPGSVSAYLSLQDTLAIRYLPRGVRAVLRVLDAAPARVRSASAHAVFRWAQRRAEADAFQRRLSVLRHDEWTASALPFSPRQGI
ncbi:MAG: hypothetical protein RI906_1047 [Pseudomonadota bacterium]|jgi:preprotein translocase subunit SecA